MIQHIDTQSDCLLWTHKNLKRAKQTEKNLCEYFSILNIFSYQKAQVSFIVQLDPMFEMSGSPFQVVFLLSTPVGAKVTQQMELAVKNVRIHRQYAGNERFQEKVSPSLLQKAGDQKNPHSS